MCLTHQQAVTPVRGCCVKHTTPAGMPLRNFFAEVVGLDDNLDIFFLGRIPTLARAWQAGGSDAGQVARQECGALGLEASDAGQECDARKHKWHLCF